MVLPIIGAIAHASVKAALSRCNTREQLCHHRAIATHWPEPACALAIASAAAKLRGNPASALPVKQALPKPFTPYSKFTGSKP
jgi:hypothetical protein